MVKNGEAPGRNIAEGFTLNYHYILREKTFAELVGERVVIVGPGTVIILSFIPILRDCNR